MVTKEQIGVYACWSCAHDVPVKKTSTGKLSAPCSWCDFPHYANPGTEHYKRLMKATKLDTPPAVVGAAPASTKEAEKKPASTPAAPAAKKSPFDPFKLS